MSFWKNPYKDVKNTARKIGDEISGKNQRDRTEGGIRESQERIKAENEASQNILNNVNEQINEKLFELAGEKAEAVKQGLAMFLVLAVVVGLLKIIF